MVVNLLVFIVLIALIGLFVWLAVRARQSRRAYIRWPGLILSGLIALVLIFIVAVALNGVYRLNVSPYRHTASDIQVNVSPERIAFAEKKAALCADCHSSTGQVPLDGSQDNFMTGSPFGVLYAPNLTPGGPLKDWTDGEIIRGIREGVDNRGRPLMIMPSVALHNLSDEDVQALVAYLRSQPAVDRPVPTRDIAFPGLVFIGAGLFPTSAQPPITSPIQTPPTGTPAYGKYIVEGYGCQDCHGAGLVGVQPGGNGPSGPNLTVLVPKWTEDQFMQVFHNGTDPSGRPLSEDMPWKSYRKALSDDELRDVYNYIHGLSPVNTNTNP
jgi:cytochrome c553